MIATGFNVITKGIFKALSSSHDYKCDYKWCRILHGKFLCVFMYRNYSIITCLSITSDFAEILHLFFQNFALCFQNFALCFHNPIFLKILLAKLAHPYMCGSWICFNCNDLNSENITDSLSYLSRMHKSWWTVWLNTYS